MADCFAPLGIADLDEQHRAMGGMLRAFQLAITKRRPDHELRTLIDTAMAALCAHCRHEEALMARYGYRDAPAHRLEHERLVLAATAFTEDVLHHRLTPDVLLEHGDVLRTLFASHIDCIDRALANHLMSLTVG
jgi:hemerythrin-like metal-binding protein